jgi:hypothetical protein
MAAASATVTVKVAYGDDVRRVTIDPASATPWDGLAAAIAAAWPPKGPLAGGYRLSAVDDEGDQVGVFSAASLADALRWANASGKLLRLEVKRECQLRLWDTRRTGRAYLDC